MRKFLALVGIVGCPLALATPMFIPNLAIVLAFLSAQLSLFLFIAAFAILLLGNPGPAGGPGTLAIPLIF